jgi:hypothetical protein
MTLEACSTLPVFKTPPWVRVSIPEPRLRIRAAFSLPGERRLVFPRRGASLFAVRRLLEVLCN